MRNLIQITPCVLVLAIVGALPAVAQGNPTAKADALFAAADWEGAIAAYSALTETDPQLGAAWFGLGRSAMQLQDYAGALKAFRNSLEREHQASSSMFGLARANAGLGHADQAIDWLFKMSETGATAQLLAKRTPEFAKLADHPKYEEALHALRPCRSKEHRQFDFWIGDWDVSNQAAPQRPPAHNRISRVQDSCVVLEEYDTPSGYTGVSLSFYDPNLKRWHQTWMDNQGAPILHSGGIENGSMVLTDNPNGETINRTTWTPLDNDQVRQHWEISNDGGKTWNTVFDGLYTRRKVVGHASAQGSKR